MTTHASPPIGEEARNRLLRRIDWRFLLPDSSFTTAAAPGDSELSDALALVYSAAPVRGATGVDLLALTNPDDGAVKRAFESLRPGGALVVETRAGRTGTSPSAVGNRLHGAGFVDVKHFALSPTHLRGRPERWVPLDSTGAVDYSFRMRPRSTNRVRKTGRRLQQWIWVSHSRLRKPSTLCSIAVRPAAPRAGAAPITAGRPSSGLFGGRPSATPSTWEEIVRRGWGDWGLGKAPSALSPLLLTSGSRSVNKVVALIFADEAREPCIAVKMPRIAESEPSLLREAATLKELQERPRPVPHIPRVLFQERIGETLLVGESIVPGRRLTEVLTPGTFPSLARQATEWQKMLADSCPGGHPAGHSALIDSVIGDFERFFGAAVDPGMFREATARLVGLEKLPVVCEQRDFAPWNILLDPAGRLGVLDWESSELAGLPTLDLIYLLTYAAIQLDGARATGRYDSTYRAMLDPKTAIGEVAGECLADYMAAVGLDRELLPSLRLFAWMIHSRSARQRLAEDNPRSLPSSTELRKTLFIRLWETELQYPAAA